MAGTVNILSDKQVAFLNFSAQQKVVTGNYYFTGGTPLAAFYLHHRYSEDLDFFIEEQEVNIQAVQTVIKKAQQQFKLQQVSYENFQGLHNFFLKYPDGELLKIDFSYYPFPRLERGKPQYGIETDSLLDIAVNKIQSIGTRTKARDFIDLYFIVKETGMLVKDLMMAARNKFDFYIDPVQYGKQFFKVTEVMDYPRMIKPLSEQDLQKFFLGEAKKLGSDILE